MKKILKVLGLVTAMVTATCLAGQPASALAKYTFEFQDQDGTDSSSGNPGEFVKGEIEFSSLEFGSIIDGTYTADSLVLTEIPSFLEASFGDNSLLDVGVNLIPFTISGGNNFILTSEQIVGIDGASASMIYQSCGGGGCEQVKLGTDTRSSYVLDTIFGPPRIDERAYDDNSSTLTFAASNSVAVPFEFSPSLGLIMMVGAFVGLRYYRKLKIKNIIDNS